MTPSSFDDLFAAAADAVRAEDDEEQRRMAEAQRAAAEREGEEADAHAAQWNDLQELGRESAQRLLAAGKAPELAIMQWREKSFMRASGFRPTGMRGWRVLVGPDHNPAAQSEQLILREDGLLSLDTTRYSSPGGVHADFPRAVPQHPSRDAYYGFVQKSGLFISHGKVVLGVEEYVHMDLSHHHEYDVRHALLTWAVRRLGL